MRSRLDYIKGYLPMAARTGCLLGRLFIDIEGDGRGLGTEQVRFRARHAGALVAV
jgi:hypothetical protein